MSTINEQISAVMDGGTVKLGEDTSAEVVVENGRTFTLDLAGFRLTAPKGRTPLHIKSGTVTVVNGSVASEGQPAIRVGVPKEGDASAPKAKAVLGSDLTVEGTDYCAVFIASNATLDTSAVIRGLYTTGNEASYAITSNGTSPYFGNTCVVRGGTITAEGDGTHPATAIYWPQEGDLVIENGTISGDTGIELRAGTLRVNGGSITGSASKFSVEANGSGPTTMGAAVAVVQHTTRLPISVGIAGGSLHGKVGLSEMNPQNNPLSAVETISLAVTGGVFDAEDGVRSQDCHSFITGGVFTAPVDSLYLSPATKLVANADGTYSYWSPIDGSECNFPSGIKADGVISSIQQGTLVGAVDELPQTGMKQNQIAYCIADRRFHRYEADRWVAEEPDIADKALDAYSDNPVANSVVEAMRVKLQEDIDSRATKAYADEQLVKKQNVLTGGVSNYAMENFDDFGKVLVTGQDGKLKTSTVDEATIEYLSNVSYNVDTRFNEVEAEIDGKVAQTAYDTKVADIEASLAGRYTKSETDAKLLAKQDKLVAGSNISISGSTISAVIPTSVVDSALSTSSVNPVQNKVVATAIGERYTKAEVDTLLDAKMPAGSYVTPTDLASALSGYATSVDLKNATTQVFRFQGVCSSSELDSKDKVVGYIWNLSDAREFGGKSYQAGTSWVYEYVDATRNGWEPMGSNFEMDLSAYQLKDLAFDGTVQSWAEDASYSAFPYKGDISNAGVGLNDTATVVFPVAQAMSGNYAPICETAEGHVYIWAKTQDTVVARVVIRKG